MAQRARGAVASGTLETTESADSSGLSKASRELIQKAEQKVLPYLDDEGVSAVTEKISSLRECLPEEEEEKRSDLELALQPYSFLM